MNKKSKQIIQKVKSLTNKKKHYQATLKTFIIRKILKKPFKAKDRNGFQYIFLPQEPIYTLFYNGYMGYPEIPEQEFCKRIIKPGMVVFDIGSNIGQFTLLFASLVGNKGQVFTFEPCKSTMLRLKKHIKLNGFTNIIPEKLLVYDKHAITVDFNIYPNEYSVWNTLGNPIMKKRESNEQIEPISQEKISTVTLDQYCKHKKINKIDYLKIDVEGGEIEVLNGCTQLFKGKAINYVQFEISQDMLKGMNHQSKEIFDFFNKFGYKCHPLTEKGDLLPSVDFSDAFFANYIAIAE